MKLHDDEPERRNIRETPRKRWIEEDPRRFEQFGSLLAEENVFRIEKINETFYRL